MIRISAAAWTEPLLELERRFWRAAGDPGFYRENMLDEGLAVLPGPYGICTKERTVELVERSPAWTHVAFHEPRVVSLAQGCAAVTYRASARNSTGADYEAYVTSVYLRRRGAWKLALHQQTPVPAPAGL